MTSLKGKTLFISGGSRGIGLAIALRAARDGANVALLAKTDTPDPRLPGTVHSAAAGSHHTPATSWTRRPRGRDGPPGG